MTNITINKAQLNDLEILLPLFDGYRKFYGQNSQESENKKYLSNLLQGNEACFLIILEDKIPIGYSAIFFSYSSVSAKKIAIINDLFVNEKKRGLGFGQVLMDYSIKYIKKSLKIEHIRWVTLKDNIKAQKSYDKIDDSNINKSSWVHYDLKTSL